MTVHDRRLEEGFIRLLSFRDDSGLVCDLQTHPRREAPPYLALSYTWGPGSYATERSKALKCSVEVNHCDFEIESNLHDALQHLGRRIRGRQRWFWVDAICINQADRVEKSAQVRRMKEIYERADGVVCWLGVPFSDDEATLAVSMMRELNAYLYTGLQENNDDIGPVLSTISKHHPSFPSERGSQTWAAWDGLAEILDKPFWRRTWIYQEATTPGSVEFCTGDHSFDDILLSAAITFGLRFADLPDFDDKFLDAAGQAGSAGALSAARNEREKPKRQRLLDLMLQVRRTGCTDPRDKVYAPLGLAADVPADRFEIDYDKELADVYIDVVRFALARPETIGYEILGFVFTPTEEASHASLSMTCAPRVPSWVPDWRHGVDIARIAHRDQVLEDGSPCYTPCPGQALDAQIDGHTFEVRGQVAHDLWVETLTTIWDDPGGSTHTPHAWYEELRAVDPSDAELEQSIRRSLVGDVTRSVRGGKENDFTSRWRRGAMIDGNIFDLAWEELDVDTWERFDWMMSDLTRMCYGRRMARLGNKTIAVVPAGAQVGDHVVAFHGGHSLYLVRSLAGTGDSYRFIGECYADGFMDGKLVDICQQRGEMAGILKLV